ncbi:MAG: signal peptidase II [Acidobacteriota bacterium]|nr:signal peptidase II [Acidobacteriota bacterium]
MTTRRDARPYLLLLAVLAVVLDRLSKLWIVKHVDPAEPITIIPHVFRITHVLNTGAAFSLFEDMSPLAVRNGLVAFSLLAVALVLVLLWRTGRTFSMGSVAFALILGGAIGNLYDRIRFHHVIDFLEVHIVHYHWPDFNIADSCICIGAALLFLEIFRPQREA